MKRCPYCNQVIEIELKRNNGTNRNVVRRNGRKQNVIHFENAIAPVDNYGYTPDYDIDNSKPNNFKRKIETYDTPIAQSTFESGFLIPIARSVLISAGLSAMIGITSNQIFYNVDFWPIFGVGFIALSTGFSILEFNKSDRNLRKLETFETEEDDGIFDKVQSFIGDLLDDGTLNDSNSNNVGIIREIKAEVIHRDDHGSVVNIGNISIPLDRLNITERNFITFANRALKWGLAESKHSKADMNGFGLRKFKELRDEVLATQLLCEQEDNGNWILTDRGKEFLRQAINEYYSNLK